MVRAQRVTSRRSVRWLVALWGLGALEVVFVGCQGREQPCGSFSEGSTFLRDLPAAGTELILKMPRPQCAVVSATLEAGEFLELRATQRELDVALRAFAPDGALILRADRPTGREGDERLLLLAQERGTYVVEIATRDVNANGMVALGLEAQRRSLPLDRLRASAALLEYRAGEMRKRGQASSPELTELYATACAQFDQSGDQSLEGNCRAALLDLLARAERWPEAREVAERALDLWRPRSSEPIGRTAVFRDAGEVLRRTGDVLRADAVLREAEASARAAGDRWNEAFILGNLSAVAESLGELGLASRYAADAYALWKSLGADREEGKAAIRMAALATTIREPGKALELLARAEARLPGTADPRDLAFLAEERGRALRWLERWDLAIKAYEEALRLRRQAKDNPGESFGMAGLAQVAYARGDFSAAQRYLEDALRGLEQRDDRPRQAAVLQSLGWVALRLGRAERARTYFEQSLALARDVRAVAVESAAHASLAVLDRDRGALASASENVSIALEMAESVRARLFVSEERGSYFGGVQSAYDLAIEIALRQAREEGSPSGASLQRIREALELSETSRARWLLDALAPEGSTAMPLGLTEIQQKLLDDGAIWLHYNLAEGASSLWAVTRQEFSHFELPAQEELAAAVRRALDEFSTEPRHPERPPPTTETLRLSKLLLPEGLPLNRHRKLLISSEGPLLHVPFAALRWDDGGAWRARLVDRFEIRLLPSASASIALASRAAGRPMPPNEVALFADPIFEREDPRITAPSATEVTVGSSRDDAAEGWAHAARSWSRLRHSQHEAEEIIAAAGGRDLVLLFTGAEASRDAFSDPRLSDFRILHFSTHGSLDAEVGDFSALALSSFNSSGREQPGELFAFEIARRAISADLVVLSACQTALGRSLEGEGQVGLAHAFLRAGATNVVASLWPVDDRSTARLMTYFYSALLHGNRDAASALTSAQRELAKERGYGHPFYWAGFVLLGGG